MTRVCLEARGKSGDMTRVCLEARGKSQLKQTSPERRVSNPPVP
jgi:hypothetical protein